MQAAKVGTEDVVIDLGRYELRRSGVRIKLEKKPMELLIFFVSRREQLVTRQDIVKELWRSSLFVDTERSVNNVVRKFVLPLGTMLKPRDFSKLSLARAIASLAP